MQNIRIIKSLLAALAVPILAVAIAGGLPVASAQSGPGGDIELGAFRPALESRGLITVNSSQVLGHKEISFGLVSSWSRNPLRFESADNTYVVENVFNPTLIGAVGLELRPLSLELGLSIPLGVVSGDRAPDTLGVPDDPNDDLRHQFDGQGLGDIAVHGKLRLLHRRHGLGLALIGSLYLPTASAENSWLGAGALRPQVMVAVDRELGRFTLAANGGFRLRTGGTSEFRDDRMLDSSGRPQPITGESIEVGSTIPLGLGMSYALVPRRIDLVTEIFGEIPVGGENYMPIEAVGGIKLYLAENSYMTLGAGAGLSSEAGNPDVRAFIGIVFEPRIGDRDGDGLKDDIDECPDRAEDHDDFADSDGCPEADNDRDGILDVDDQCPNNPEDKDGFEDEDGCPEGNESDRDGDGILDDDDACPDDPEDFDGFEDEDGCPDNDNDGDGMLDADDLCPDNPEDLDSFEDDDGCPDIDNDRDRILDEDDECPDEPEVYNDNEDGDGCPDRGPVIINDRELIPLDKIYFEYDSAVIKEQSFPILETLARVINLNPDVAQIEIQGHTDERGPAPYNLRLSQARAESVRDFLVAQGVDEGRLDPRGYGETQPIESGRNERAWAANRRVEFVIVRRSSD